MIYDYEDQEGYVSIWIGNCKDYDVLDQYLSTVYLDDEEDFDDGLHPPRRLKKCFFPPIKTGRVRKKSVTALIMNGIISLSMILDWYLMKILERQMYVKVLQET